MDRQLRPLDDANPDLSDDVGEGGKILVYRHPEYDWAALIASLREVPLPVR